ncbi:putative cargo-transport protein ypp1, partial [Neolecta irregularis DAH-3]
QSISQSVNQSISQSVSQSINQSINQSTTNQPTNRTTNQPINQPTNQSTIMSTPSTKAARYHAALHLARCQSRYLDIPELARKLRKHAPASGSLASTATAEALLELAVAAAGISHFADPSSHLLSSSQIADIRENLAAAASPEPSLQEKQQLEIVTAKLELVIGNPREAQRKTQFLAAENIPSAPTDYPAILLLKGLAVNGMYIHAAFPVYKRVTETIDLNNDLFQETKNVLEVILYRHAILAKTLLTESIPALSCFKLYANFITATCPDDWRLTNRSNLYRQYFLFLSHAYSIDPQRINSDLVAITTVYQDLLYKTTVFPHAGHTNPLLLEFVHLLMENHKSRGSPKEDCPRILDARSQISPLIPVSLSCRGENFPLSHDHASSDDNLHSNGRLLYGPQFIRAIPANNLGDIDSDETFLETICTGVRLCAKFLQDGVEAVKYAEMAKEISVTLKISDTRLLALVCQAQGIAYAYEARNRPGLQLEAIKHLVNSQKLLSNQSIHYLLALQYAENRDVLDALHHIRISLQFSHTHIPSWHLLALLLSAQENFEDALDACEAAFSVAKVDQDELTVDQLGFDLETRVAILQVKITQIAIIEMSIG